MATKKFRISAVFTGDATGLIATTKRLGQNLKTTGDLFTQFGRQATAGMAAVNAAFIGSAAAGAKLADQFAKTSFRLDTNIGSLRELSFAAEQSGADLTTIQTAFRRLTTNVLDAASGLEEAKRNFTQLGVSIRDSSGNIKKQDALFKEVAVKLGKMENATIRQGLALKLLGRSGDRLAPLFANLGRDENTFLKQLELVNSTIDKQTGLLGEDVVDAFNLFRKSIEGVNLAMLRALGPALEQALILFSSIIAAVSRFIDRNRDMILSVAKTAVKIGVAVTAFTTWSIGVAAVGAALSAFATFIAGPVAASFVSFGLIVGGTALVMIELTKSTSHARLAVEVLIGVLGIAALALALFFKNAVLATQGAALLAATIAIHFGTPKLAALMAEVNETFAALQAEIEKTKKELERAGGAAGNFAGDVDKIGVKLRQLRATAAASDIAAFTDIIARGFSLGFSDSALGAIRSSMTAIFKDIESGALNDIAKIGRLVSQALEEAFFNLGGGGTGDLSITAAEVPDPFDAVKRGIKKAFGGGETAESVVAIQEFANVMDDINPKLAQGAREVIGLSNKLQGVANVALREFGDLGIRVAESMLSSFLEIGDAVGSMIENIRFGVDEFSQLEEQLRTQEIQSNLAETVKEQEKWTEAAEATRKQMLRLELAAIQNKSAWESFFNNMGKWVKKLIADVAALIIKMAILKALSSFGPFGFLGGFLPLGKGGLVPADFTGPILPRLGAKGGFVTGGIPGRDSVPSLLMPGELVIPTDAVEAALGSISSPSGTIVNINAGLLAGDEGTAREIVRLIQEKMRFLDTGKTL